MAKCDPNALMAKASAGCYACQDGNVNSVLETQLLCNWLTNLQPPTTGNFRITDDGGIRLTDDVGFRIVVP